jgi:hypothetical protein
MPITTTKPVVITPSLSADKLAVKLVIEPTIKETDIGASAIISAQPYAALSTGKNLPVGAPRMCRMADVYAEAAANPALGAEVVIITESLARVVALLEAANRLA